MSEKGAKQNKAILFSAFSVLTVVALIWIWQCKVPFQLDNDNIYLKTIASGEMTGTPEARMLHMDILSGTILRLLYSLTGNGIPWFGLFLCTAMGIPMAMLLRDSLRACKNVFALLSVYLLWIVVFCSFFYHYFVAMQYTLATGILGAGALFALARSSFEEKGRPFIWSLLPFFLLSWLSFGMREKAFLMLIPFMGMTFLEKMLRTRSKETVIRILVTGIVFLLSLAALFAGNEIAYGKAEWREFREYNMARENIIDYNGFPDYETHEELYRELGITRSSYEAIVHHYNIILDPAINRDSLVKLEEVASAEARQGRPTAWVKLGNAIKHIVKRNFLDYIDRPMNILVYLLYLSVFVLAILEKKKWGCVQLIFVGVARMVDWLYLALVERDPFRVTQIIYVAELALLVAIILDQRLWEFTGWWSKKGDKKYVHPVFGLLLLTILFAGVRFGQPVMRDAYGHAYGTRNASICFRELESYLSEHGDNFYYFDMSHLYYTENALEFAPSPYENYVYMGSWMPNSPWYAEKLRRFGISDVAGDLLTKENLYILYQQVDFDERDFLDDYFEEHFPGTTIEKVDEFVSSNGFRYEILKPVQKLQ